MTSPARVYTERPRTMVRNRYSDREQIADNSVNFFGVALSIGCTYLLIDTALGAGDALMLASFGIYGLSVFLAASGSALYNGVHNVEIKAVLRIVDHCTIYLLIAGTYTPLALVGLRGTGWDWRMLAVVWPLAGLGMALKALYPGRFERFSIVLYLSLGWIGVAAIGALETNIATPGLILLAAGGGLFSAGLIFLFWHRLRFHNVIWHAFALAGTTAHFLAMLLYVRPPA